VTVALFSAIPSLHGPLPIAGFGYSRSTRYAVPLFSSPSCSYPFNSPPLPLFGENPFGLLVSFSFSVILSSPGPSSGFCPFFAREKARTCGFLPKLPSAVSSLYHHPPAILSFSLPSGTPRFLIGPAEANRHLRPRFDLFTSSLSFGFPRRATSAPPRLLAFFRRRIDRPSYSQPHAQEWVFSFSLFCALFPPGAPASF